MTEKVQRCANCGIVQPLINFYRDRSRRLGVYNRCRTCESKRNAERTPARFGPGSIYNTYAKRAAKIKRAYLKNPLPYKARHAVSIAIKEGKLSRGECHLASNECSGKVQAHHHAGYDKPNWLNVVWVCKHHHNKITYEK